MLGKFLCPSAFVFFSQSSAVALSSVLFVFKCVPLALQILFVGNKEMAASQIKHPVKIFGKKDKKMLHGGISKVKEVLFTPPILV